MQAVDDPKYLNIMSTAKLLGVSRGTIYRYIELGLKASIPREGMRDRIIKVSDLEEFLYGNDMK